MRNMSILAGVDSWPELLLGSFRQRQRTLAENISPSLRGAHVGVAEPHHAVERFSVVRAFLPQFGCDDRSVAPNTNHLIYVVLTFVMHQPTARFCNQVGFAVGFAGA